MEKDRLADRYAAVKASLPPHVTLVAVSKTRSVAEIQALYELGQRDFGENYPQELREKAPSLPGDIRWHFIGHLQRSNVKHVVPLAHLIHGVDSLRTLDEVEKRCASIGRRTSALLQVYIAREETKHGFSEEEIGAWWGREDPALRWPHVQLSGLMGMATLTDDTDQLAREFSGLQRFHADLRSTAWVEPAQFRVLSMGMSSDAHLAIAAGSTLVRIGTAIFGER